MTRRYPKIHQLGTRESQGIFDDEVTISEKIDGSQCNFGIDLKYGLTVLSKKSEVQLGDGNKLFSPACSHIYAVADEGVLEEGYSYHAETLCSPRHSTLTYDRVPLNNLALYGVTRSDGTIVADRDELTDIARRLRIDVVPHFFVGRVDPTKVLEMLNEYLGQESYLGKAKIEGVVVKNTVKSVMYGGMVFPIMIAKFVSDSFKETHKTEWPKNNKAPIQVIGEMVRTQARWDKAIMRVRETGVDMDTPKVIGAIMKELHNDFMQEDKETIKNMLFSAFSKDLQKVATRGFPEFWKRRLIDQNLTITEFDKKDRWDLEGLVPQQESKNVDETAEAA